MKTALTTQTRTTRTTTEIFVKVLKTYLLQKLLAKGKNRTLFYEIYYGERNSLYRPAKPKINIFACDCILTVAIVKQIRREI
jgi:hypothetical protein